MTTQEENPVYRAIHNALHDKSIGALNIGGVIYKINIASNGCRKLVYNGLVFMEQNKDKMHGTKLSDWAQEARNGRKITWIQQPGRWQVITD